MNFIKVFLILLLIIMANDQDPKKVMYAKQYDTLNKTLDSMDVKYDSLLLKMEQLKKK